MSAVVIVFGIAVLACVVSQVAILRSLVGRADVAADPGVPRPGLIGEIVWALIPALILAFVLTATWARVRENAVPRPAPVMKIAR